MQIQACFDSIVDPTYTTEVITFLSRREAPSIAKKSRATLLMNKLKKISYGIFIGMQNSLTRLDKNFTLCMFKNVDIDQNEPVGNEYSHARLWIFHAHLRSVKYRVFHIEMFLLNCI